MMLNITKYALSAELKQLRKLVADYSMAIQEYYESGISSDALEIMAEAVDAKVHNLRKKTKYF